jgi:hypothetical protein
MPDKVSIVDKWVKEQIQHLRTIPWVRWTLSVGVVVVAILFVPTIAEFIVALYNRYRVYPSDIYETSMLAKSIGVSGVLSLAAAFLVGYIIKIMQVRWFWVVGFLFLSGLFCMVPDGGSWLAKALTIPILIVFAITVGLSFKAKIPFLVALLGFLIMLLARPSMLPPDWCKYELTVYSCSPAQETQYIR